MKTTDFITEGIGQDADNMHKDHEVQMARQDCYNAAKDAIDLHKLLATISEMQGLEGWVSEKITLAADYLRTVKEHFEYEQMSQEQSLLPEFTFEDADAQMAALLEDSSDEAMAAFLAKGGEVKQGAYKKPRKSEKTDYGSKHIGGAGDKMRASRTGVAAKTQGSKIVGMAEEQLDELSPELLGRYKKAASAASSDADKAGDYDLGHKRYKGIIKATKKQFAHDVKKHQEQDVAEGVAETLLMQDAVKVLKHYGAEHFKTTSNELHFYKNGRPLSVDLVMNPDTTRSVTLSSLNAATRGLKGQGVAEGTNNIGNKIKALYQKIYSAGDDAIEFAYNDSPIFAQYWDEYEGDLDSIIAEINPQELQVIADELESAVEDQGLLEASLAQMRDYFNQDDKKKGVSEGFESDKNNWYVLNVQQRKIIASDLSREKALQVAKNNPGTSVWLTRDGYFTNVTHDVSYPGRGWIDVSEGVAGGSNTPNYKVGDTVSVRGYQGVGKIAYIKARNDVGVIFSEPEQGLRVRTTIDKLLPKEGVAESLSENRVDSPVSAAIIRRILNQHHGLLQKYGPQAVMDAVDEVASWVDLGPNDEIGTSDVSGWVQQVITYVRTRAGEGLAESAGGTGAGGIASVVSTLGGKAKGPGTGVPKKAGNILKRVSPQIGKGIYK